MYKYHQQQERIESKARNHRLQINRNDGMWRAGESRRTFSSSLITLIASCSCSGAFLLVDQRRIRAIRRPFFLGGIFLPEKASFSPISRLASPPRRLEGDRGEDAGRMNVREVSFRPYFRRSYLLSSYGSSSESSFGRSSGRSSGSLSGSKSLNSSIMKGSAVFHPRHPQFRNPYWPKVTPGRLGSLAFLMASAFS